MQAKHWFEAVAACQATGIGYVLVTNLSPMGSVPRESGAKMVVCEDAIVDTIGGGHLEHKAIAQARALLAEGKQVQTLAHFPLASKLGQCCGGTTHVLYEVFVEHCQTLAVYGAGHVAKALMPMLSNLPMQIQWIDPRKEMFGDGNFTNVTCVEDPHPVDTLSSLPNASWILIMTHDHQLDFDLVKAALKRKDFEYIGMIGSDTKARRFRTRLSRQNVSDSDVARLVSPVGITTIPGKRPFEVAVSITAQLIQNLHAAESTGNQTQEKLQWQQTQAILNHDP